MTIRQLSLVSTCLCGMVAGAGSAWASGFALLEQSAESQGSSHAGAAARADDPSTLFFNPAGMAYLSGNQVANSFSLILPSATLQSGSLTTGAAFGLRPLGGSAGQDAGTNAVIPTFYGTVQLSPDWHVGLSVTSPFGLVTQYAPNSIARYYGVTSQLETIDVTPAVSWRPLPALSLGAGLIIESAKARESNAIDFGSVLAGLGAPVRPGSLDGIATNKGSDTALGWQLGLIYEPQPGTRIGIDYRSTIDHKLTGSLTFEGVPLPLTVSPAFQSQASTAKVPLPGNVTVGLAQDVGPFTLLLGATWTQWSVFRQLNVVYGSSASTTIDRWHDTATVSAGADWRLNDQFTLRGGVAWDQSPVSDQYRTPVVPDGNRYWISVGGTWNVNRNLALSLAYSHIFVDSTTVSLVDAGPGTVNFLRGNLTGSYSNHIDIAAAEAKLTF